MVCRGDKAKGTTTGGECAGINFRAPGRLRLTAKCKIEGAQRWTVVWKEDWPGLDQKLEEVNKGAKKDSITPQKSPQKSTPQSSRKQVARFRRRVSNQDAINLLNDEPHDKGKGVQPDQESGDDSEGHVLGSQGGRAAAKKASAKIAAGAAEDVVVSALH